MGGYALHGKLKGGDKSITDRRSNLERKKEKGKEVRRGGGF